jgi:hypothetical protein
MAKKIDPAVAKAAKQKKLAIVGGVLLLGLLAFQVPRTMKMLHGQGTVTTSASTAPASTTATGSTPLAPPALDGGSTSAAASGTSGTSAETSDDGVTDPSTPLPPTSGQLRSFSQFKSKDPFQQQVHDCVSGDSCAAGPAPSGGSGGSPTSAASGGGSSGVLGGGGSTAGASPAKSSPSAAAAARKPTTATISVNGTVEKVRVKAGFPAADPVFVLVAVTSKEAMIGIAGGSLESGADAIGLKVGRTLKLQNTADSATYVLKLVAVS